MKCNCQNHDVPEVKWWMFPLIPVVIMVGTGATLWVIFAICRLFGVPNC